MIVHIKHLNTKQYLMYKLLAVFLCPCWMVSEHVNIHQDTHLQHPPP